MCAVQEVAATEQRCIGTEHRGGHAAEIIRDTVNLLAGIVLTQEYHIISAVVQRCAFLQQGNATITTNTKIERRQRSQAKNAAKGVSDLKQRYITKNQVVDHHRTHVFTAHIAAFDKACGDHISACMDNTAVLGAGIRQVGKCNPVYWWLVIVVVIVVIDLLVVGDVGQYDFGTIKRHLPHTFCGSR
ncbi:hypothetical protein GM31_21820 [Trabulsiella odontotermitis]|uniref:Uncharacterized protein n=1 Tax=Trabulsiella odontotermitis TaxID=379893 RepID=A0A0L0H4W0_9ENTR|nr:hypothetical protein GM31_21820 [Trabulsiella odontotermitis]